MKHDPRYRTLKAIRVYNNNLILNDNKSSDYWETAMQRPDLLLKDLSALFHPEYFPGYQLRWYRKL
jgi:iron complex transport system substrate-binding protein